MIADAIKNLRPDSEFMVEIHSDGKRVIRWITEMPNPPTDEEIDAEIERLEQEMIAKDYRRKRKAEYPPLSDFADAIYWAQKGNNTFLTQWIANCEAVKQKYPKSE
jgi:hypothetical protein